MNNVSIIQDYGNITEENSSKFTFDLIDCEAISKFFHNLKIDFWIAFTFVSIVVIVFNMNKDQLLRVIDIFIQRRQNRRRDDLNNVGNTTREMNETSLQGNQV